MSPALILPYLFAAFFIGIGYGAYLDQPRSRLTERSVVVGAIVGGLLWPVITVVVLVWCVRKVPAAARYLAGGVSDLKQEFFPRRPEVPRAVARKKEAA